MSDRYFEKFNGYTVSDPEAVKRSSKKLIAPGANVARFYEILKSYMDNTDKFYYATPSFVGYDFHEETGEFTPKTITGKYVDGAAKFPVVCASLVWLALSGVGFENCRINTGAVSDVTENGETVPQLVGGDNIPYSGACLIDGKDPEIIKYWQYSGHGSVYSHQIAKLFDDCGLLHEIKTSTFSELTPGDILFYDNYEEGSQVTVPFKNISHVEIFLGWSGNELITITTDNDPAKDTVRYVRTNRRPTNNTAMANYLKYYARIPVNGLWDAKDIITSKKVSYTKGISALFGVSEPLERNRAYHLIMKVKNAIGANRRFSIYPAVNEAAVTTAGTCGLLTFDNKANNIAPDTYYTTLVIPAGIDFDPTQLRIYYNVDGADGSAELQEVRLYNKLVNL